MDPNIHVEIGFFNNQRQFTSVDKAGFDQILEDHLRQHPPYSNHIISRLFSYDPVVKATHEQTLKKKFGLNDFRYSSDTQASSRTDTTGLDYQMNFRTAWCRCTKCAGSNPCGRELFEMSFGVCTVQPIAEREGNNYELSDNSIIKGKDGYKYSGDSITFPGTILNTKVLDISLIKTQIIHRKDSQGSSHLEALRFGPMKGSEMYDTPIGYVVSELQMLNNAWADIVKESKYLLFTLVGSLEAPNKDLLDATFRGADRKLLYRMVKYAQTWDQLYRVQQQQLEVLSGQFSQVTYKNEIWFGPPEIPVIQILTASTTDNFPGGPQQQEERDPRLDEIRAALDELTNIGKKIEVQLVKETRTLVERVIFITSRNEAITHTILSIDEAFSQNGSIKRLTWVTSLFGMNIDILKNNPSWIYYLSFALPMFFLIMVPILVLKWWGQLAAFLRGRRDSAVYWYRTVYFKNLVDTMVGFSLTRKKAFDLESGPRGDKNKRLVIASRNGNLDEVRRLVLHGAEVNCADIVGKGPTALQAAAKRGHLEIVEQLIKYKANVNAPPGGIGGYTALQAAAGSYLEVVERLLDSKADVNAQPAEVKGRTALQAAAENGRLDIVDRLLECGADVNAPTAKFSGRTALQAAADGGHMHIVDRLLTPRMAVQRRGTSHSKMGDRGRLPISEADVNVNAKPADIDGRTALQAAAESGYIEIVEKLVNFGADVNIPPAQHGGRTALQAAAERGYIEIVEKLISFGADVNIPPAKHGGSTALQAAAGRGHMNVVELLIYHGARVTDQGRCVALTAAAGGGHLDVADFLMRKEQIHYLEIWDALKVAAYGGHYTMVDLLLRMGAVVDSPAMGHVGLALSAAVVRGHEDIVELLLRSGASIDQPGLDGYTALMAAAAQGNEDSVGFLLRSGASIDHPAFDGRTPLVVAIDNKQHDMVRFLVRRGANVNSRVDGGRTALQAAAESGQKQVVEMLIRNGAEFDDAMLERVRAISMAVPVDQRGEYEGVIWILSRAGARQYGG